MNTLTSKSNEDALTMPQRVGEVMILGLMLLLLCFFGYHQFANTGFFTDRFGTLEMLCLYGPILFALAAPLSRAVNGRRNPARVPEALANLALALGSLWLLAVFPFNYAHLADPLPFPLHYLIGWFTDDIARILLVLQIIVALLTSIVIGLKYLTSGLLFPNARETR